MRLIDTSSYKIIEFHPPEIPPYAILSHTWEEDEYLFADRLLPSRRKSAGFRKVSSCCALAASEGHKYLWIDTCCIDKTSSAELTESINSMYRWYERSEICYVYLSDFALQPHLRSGAEKSFGDCRWFTRGWTLQELLAPFQVVFYDTDWVEIGSKTFLQSQISRICRISPQHMEDPKSASIAIKMSWASRRKTSREEDIAYSLLGLFDINMPLIYGEGQNAFYRLQCELIKSSSDETIFAWCAENYLDLSECTGILAKHPAAFKESNDVVPTSFGKRAPYSMTNNGLAIDLLCHPMPDFAPEESCETYFFTTLHCAHESNLEDSIILRMQNQHDDCATLYVSRRLESVSCIKNGGEELIPARTRSIYVHQSMQRSPIRSGSIARLWGYSPRLVTLTRVAQSHFTFNPRLSGPVDCIEIMDNGSIKVPSKKVEERLKLVFETNDGYAFMLAPYCDDGAFFSDSRSEDYTDCIENIKDRQDILGESTILIGARDNYSKRIDRHAFLWIKSRTCRNEVNDFCISLVIDVTSIDRARILNIKQRRRRRPGG